MFGFFVGTVCLIGLLGMVRGGSCRGGARRGWHDEGFTSHRGRRARGRRGRGFAGRAAGEMFKRRLDVDEDQEDIVDLAVADLQSAIKELGAVVADSRGDLAGAFRGEEVDEGAVDAVFVRHDEELARARRQVVSALKQIHAVLDPEQRHQAADWLGAPETRWV